MKIKYLYSLSLLAVCLSSYRLALSMDDSSRVPSEGKQEVMDNQGNTPNLNVVEKEEQLSADKLLLSDKEAEIVSLLNGRDRAYYLDCKRKLNELNDELSAVVAQELAYDVKAQELRATKNKLQDKIETVSQKMADLEKKHIPRHIFSNLPEESKKSNGQFGDLAEIEEPVVDIAVQPDTKSLIKLGSIVTCTALVAVLAYKYLFGSNEKSTK